MLAATSIIIETSQLTTMGSTTVYAQTAGNTTTTTSTTQQIIDNVQAACSETTATGFTEECVSVIHESPTTLVLEGRLLLVLGGAQIGLVDNPYIWQAVDRFKAQGYALNSVLLIGQGSLDSPHNWYIVMSKQ